MGRHALIRGEAQPRYQFFVHDKAVGPSLLRLDEPFKLEWTIEGDFGFCRSPDVVAPRFSGVDDAGNEAPECRGFIGGGRK